MDAKPSSSKSATRKAAQSGTFARAASSGRPAAKVSAGAGTTKISVTVPHEVLAEVRSLGPDNLSAVVADALRAWTARARLGRMLDELDAIHGPVPSDVAAEIEATWEPIFDRSAARRGEGQKA